MILGKIVLCLSILPSFLLDETNPLRPFVSSNWIHKNSKTCISKSVKIELTALNIQKWPPSNNLHFNKKWLKGRWHMNTCHPISLNSTKVNVSFTYLPYIFTLLIFNSLLLESIWPWILMYSNLCKQKAPSLSLAS